MQNAIAGSGSESKNGDVREPVEGGVQKGNDDNQSGETEARPEAELAQGVFPRAGANAW
jgi:hypothetical protein